VTSSSSASESGTVPIDQIKSWKDLAPTPLLKTKVGFVLCQFKAPNGSDVSLIVVDLNSKTLTFKPFFNQTKATTSEAAKRLHALAAVNGGYFNLNNGESTSYVVIDQKQQCDPTTNKALVNNPKLTNYLPAIFRRSEVRFLRGGKGQHKIAITYHDTAIPAGWMLEHSLQAGPRLLPDLTSKEEVFVRSDPDGKMVDSIGCHLTAARTAFGITPDNHAMLICVAGKGQSEFSSGITLPDLASLLKRLGCTDAINFDGGTSTTMVINQDLVGSDSDSTPYKQLCGKTPEKLVASGLAIIER
jgi:exopolysaccharide biosynthesis protein